VSIVIRVTLPVEVSFDYLPPDPQHGIQRADIEVTRVELGGVDVTRGIEPRDMQEIANAVWEYEE
jgi:hypothetical protein